MKNVRKLIQKCLKEVFLENSNSPMNKLKNVIVNSLDFEGYNISASGDNKIRAFFEIFKNEQGFEIKRSGIKKALENYIRGLPTSLNLPYNHEEVRNMMYALDFDEAKEMDIEELDNLFYKSVVEVILNEVN